MRSAERAQPRHGVRGLRALPASLDLREHRLSAEAQEGARPRSRAASGWCSTCSGSTPRATATCARLSGGAQQRVSIGRALVRNPELILFDEPLCHLDADQKIFLRTEIKRLQQETGLTSILVTHDQTEATAIADRIAILDEGVLQQVGAPQELYDAPANLFVANFIGEPPMNFSRSARRRQAGSSSKARAWPHAHGRHRGAPHARRGAARPDPRPQARACAAGARRPGRARSRGDGVLPRAARRRGGAARRSSRSRRKARRTLAIELPGPTACARASAFALNFPVERLLFFAADSGRNLSSARR